MVNCCINGCKSRSERNQPNITFHRFPNEPILRKKWTECTGRINWHPSRHSRICSRHFEASCIRQKLNSTHLNPHSIPTLFIQVQPALDQPSTSKCDTLGVDVQAKDYLLDGSSITDSHGHLSLPLEVAMEVEIESTMTQEILPIVAAPELEMTPRKKKLISKLKKKTILSDNRRKKLAALRSKTWRLQKKTAEQSTIIEELKTRSLINQEAADLLSSIDATNRDFLKRFLCKNIAERKYSPELRKFALSLHYISSKAYSFVRKQFNTCLPHPRTLSRWYQCIDGNPGFSTESIKAVKFLHEINTKKNTSHKTICALSFDEMAIRKGLDFDGKDCIGFVNFGNNVNNDQLAKDALIFMLTCVNGSWKIPLGYFLIDGISAEQKASLVKNCIEILTQDCGIEIISLTFDGCPTNFSMAKVLGCKLDGDNIDPSFTVGNNNIVIFPDPSHMLKLVRNTLGEKGPITDSQGRVVSWEYVKLLVELQDNEGLHLGNKLNKSHINFYKQIMKVKLAAQVMSESVANAIQFCNIELNIDEFKNSAGTVDFIQKINNLFDVMNSRNLKAYSYKKPLSVNNFSHIKPFLDEMILYLNNLKLGDRNIMSSNRKTGFLGFLICIKSVINLYETQVINNNLQFLSTYKLSQDHLEYFFSAIRAKGGFNNNPSARQLKSAFKRMLVHGEMKHITSGNCIPLQHINILTLTKPEIAINKTSEKNIMIDNVAESSNSEYFDEVLMKDHDYLTDPSLLTEFSKHVIVYIAGFVVSKLKKELSCEECVSAIISDTKYASLQLQKDKGGLCYPSKDVAKICEICEIIFRKNRGLNKKNVLIVLMQESLRRCLGLTLFFKISHFNSQTFLDCHYSLLIKAISLKYFKVRIHYATKKLSEKTDKVRNFYNKLVLFKGQ